MFGNSETWQVSCSALCDKNEATICPSGKCSACASDAQVENGTMNKTEDRTREGRSIYTYSSSDLMYCTNARHNCNFRKHPTCCANALCKHWLPNSHNKKCVNRYFEGEFVEPKLSLKHNLQEKAVHGPQCPSMVSGPVSTWRLQCKIQSQGRQPGTMSPKPEGRVSGEKTQYIIDSHIHCF